MGRTLRDCVLLAMVALASTLAVWWRVGLDTVRQNFDGPYYAVVARSWYNPQVIRTFFSFPLPLEYYPAHLPLLPFLMRTLDEFLGVGYLNAGLIVTQMATVGAAFALYFAVGKLKFGQPLVVALAWLFWWPRIWTVRSIVSPETLFIFFVILSLYFFEKRRFLFSGLAGAAAVLTKSPGILLFAAYGLWAISEYIQSRKIHWQIWPTLLIPVALVGLFAFYWLQTGDFLAYFHSGDNIHLQILPFKVFDSSQPWVGDFWLEDILWIYIFTAVGTWKTFKKSYIWGWFGLVYFLSIIFVSHRDVSRYALPLAPVALVGWSEIFARKEVRWALALLTIPLFLYTVNFLSHNTVAISDWAPFFSR